MKLYLKSLTLDGLIKALKISYTWKSTCIMMYEQGVNLQLVRAPDIYSYTHTWIECDVENSMSGFRQGMIDVSS